MTDAAYGTLEPAGARWTLRYTRHLAHPPEKVWRALTEPEHLAEWFPTTIEGFPHEGAVLRFADRDHPGPAFEGELVVFDPPHALEFWWGTDRLRFTLRREGDGCLLELSDTFDELGKAARDAAGWHACLDALAHHLDGAVPPSTTSERWAEVHPVYGERFGPEALTIGPPPGR